MESTLYTYHLLGVRTDPRMCVIETLDERVQNYLLLTKVVRLGERFDSTVALEIAPEGGDWITDFINNIHCVAILSQKARRVMESEGLDDSLVEYLPFVLRDRRGEVVSDERFFIANTLQSVECFDWDRSVYETFPGKPRKLVFAGMERMFLREAEIPADAKFFRLGEQKSRLIIRSDLLQRLRDEGCTGINVTAMGEELL